MATPAELVFYGALGFLIGVFVAAVGWNVYLVLAGVLIAKWLLYVFKKSTVRLGIIFILALVLGVLYYHFYLNLQNTKQRITLDQEIQFQSIIVSEPRFTEKTQQFYVKFLAPYRGKIKIVTDQIPNFHYGDLLELNTKLTREETPYMPMEEIVALFPKIELRDKHHGIWIKEKLLGLKEHLVGQFKRFLPADSAALLSGITFGHRSDFSQELKEKMAASGTTHIVALSGYNIAVLVLAVSTFFRSFLKRRLTFWLTTITIVLFVIMVGAEASVVRAAIMGFLVLLAREVGRLYSFRNAVVLAAAAMVIFDPTILIFNIGFQLSFMSLLGIVYLEPALRELFGRFRRTPSFGKNTTKAQSFLGWKENALMTLSAQLAVAPLIIQNFNTASLTAIFANILILTFVPLTMALGFILALVASLFSYLGVFIAWFVNILLGYEIFVIDLFARLKIPISGRFGNIAVFMVYYAVLLGIIMYARKYGKTNTR